MSLTGSFRVSSKEFQVIYELRTREASINYIAKLVKRSTATVHLYTNSLSQYIDNRKNTPKSRTEGRNNWLSKINTIRLKLKLYFLGVYDTVAQALDDPVIPTRTLYLLNENSNTEQDTEPP